MSKVNLNIRMEGMDDILEKIEDLADAAALRQALGQACALVERDAKRKAPKGAGELQRSITSTVENRGDELVGVIYTPLEYAP